MNRKKNALALAAIITAAATMPTSAFAENWTAYARKFQISFPGYSGTTALSGFPVLVRLSPELNGFDYSRCRLANGGDLRFADAGGNVIPHEIDTWNTSGESLVWVKVPSLTKGTTITAYYGNPSPCAASADSVWDSGYVAVWHLGESTLPLAESTGVTTPFSSSNGTVRLAATGIVGGAVDFSNYSASSWLQAKDDDDLDGFDSFTFEVWTKSDPTATPGTEPKTILSKRQNGSSHMSYTLTYWKEWDGVYAYFDMGEYGSGTSAKKIVSTKELIPEKGAWAHTAIVRDTGESVQYAYLDGDSKTVGGTYNGTRLYSGPMDLEMGNLQGLQNRAFNGLIDEVRISRVARSADWIKATHDTVALDGFAVYSGLSDDWKSYSHRFGVSFGYAGSSPLSGFPVLVRIAEYDEGTGKGIRGFSYADMKMAKGGDLRFSDADGNLLPHEIDTWNPDGESTVWVKVPTLSASTKITAYYGSVVPCPPSAESVWDSGYVAVWHLGESTLPLVESTGVTTPFSSSNGTVRLAATGIVGGAVDFSNYSASSWLQAKDDDDLDGFDSFTFEVWTKSDPTATPGTEPKTILSKRQNGSSHMSYTLTYWKEWDGVYAYFDMGEYGSGTSAKKIVSTKELIPEKGAWAHTAIVRDTGESVQYAYLDGDSKTVGGTYNGTRLYSGPMDLEMGNLQGLQNRAFNGLIDEVRISRVARSADWIKATHETVAADGFATLSAARENSEATMVVFR